MDVVCFVEKGALMDIEEDMSKFDDDCEVEVTQFHKESAGDLSSNSGEDEWVDDEDEELMVVDEQ